MVLREITVGRSKDCDIYLDPRCKYASGHHGTIYYDGSRLMFRDTSTNGTMINNVSVKKRAVPIQHGDIIMLAGQYQLNWNQIDAFFPSASYQQNFNNSNFNSAFTSPAQPANMQQLAIPEYKWNWGAFALYPIWGFFNGCWWAILISVFFGWTIIPNFVFGIYGSRWAWENKQWSSVNDFKQAQSSWSTAGIIILCLNLVTWLILLVVYAGFIASLL